MRSAIYARVSTVDQHCEMQLGELREYCQRRGWTISGEYVDTGWSGAKASRPELDRVLKDASVHKFDVILVWKLDRFGRSVQNISEQLARLNSWGIRFIATSQSLDTDQANPTSRLLLHILASVAEFEREMIRERVSAGVKVYRDAYRDGKIGKARHSLSGKNLPPGRPRSVFDRQRALELRAKGMSLRTVAKRFGIGVATAHRLIAESQKAAKKGQKRVFQKPISRPKPRR